MNNNTNYEKIPLKSLKAMFTMDNVKRPANKTSNHAIITLIDLINDNARMVECERSKGGTILNRGSVVECLVKLLINDQKSAKKYLAKSRGQYGLMLNLNKDFLYIITALCVKENKIKLNDLFDEYERRGLFFDRYSKEEIVTLLNKWNLIDKKSDSGDAQYVKSIL